MTFSEPTLQGASREQCPSVHCGIDELLKFDEFPTGSRLYLIPGATDLLEVKLTYMDCTVRQHLEFETFRGVQDAAHNLLRLLNSRIYR
jgi:hypothetical protein